MEIISTFTFMANWDKLNQELDNLLENISDQEWESWSENRESRKAIRRLQIKFLNKKALCHPLKK